MITPRTITDLVQTIFDNLPPGFKNMPEDVQQQLRVVLNSTFSKLELVTREEFDAQRAVLLRTREKLECLEKKITSFEQEK